MLPETGTSKSFPEMTRAEIESLHKQIYFKAKREPGDDETLTALDAALSIGQSSWGEAEKQ